MVSDERTSDVGETEYGTPMMPGPDAAPSSQPLPISSDQPPVANAAEDLESTRFEAPIGLLDLQTETDDEEEEDEFWDDLYDRYATDDEAASEADEHAFIDEDDDAFVREPLAAHSHTRVSLGPSRSFRQRGQALYERAWQGIRDLTTEQWLWIGVVLLAAILRLWGLGDKPLHHDESMHAYYSLWFARDPSSYAYNPLLHGPFQFHAEGFMFAIILAAEHLFGVGSATGNPWINDFTARIVPALFGVGIVALPIGLRRELGRVGALITSFLLAVSPAFVYFSRFLREDIYFNFFMFAMVVCTVQFIHKRTTGWFVTTFLMAVLAYATFEGFFLTLAIFGGFLVVLAAWELANGLARVLPQTLTARERAFFSRTLVMLALATVVGTAALIGLHWLSVLSTAIAKVDPTGTNPPAWVPGLENASVAVLLYASIAIALVVIIVLLWQLGHDTSALTVTQPRRPSLDADLDEAVSPRTPSFAERVEYYALAPTRGILRLRARLDPADQPFLRLLLNINWVQWFVAFVLSWMLFAALFWIIPGPSQPGMTLGEGFAKGVGSGMWQGLYYWLTQQQVARGGQPPYYYLMLIPLYEQLVVVFGLAGLVYALARPTRFRLFLVWWFVASLGLYSWAGEKMPWLTIHILLPLFLLAGIMLNWIYQQCVTYVPALFPRYFGQQSGELALAGLGRSGSAGALGGWRTNFARTSFGRVLFPSQRTPAADGDGTPEPREVENTGDEHDAEAEIEQQRLIAEERARRKIRRRGIAGLVGAAGAVLLLIPMVHSMWILSHPDAAKGPLEMMVYVQTTDDVDLVMNKINYADQKLSGGKHQLRIAVGTGEEWPMYWYLRDYYMDSHPLSYVDFGYNPSQANAPQEDVLILLPSDAQAFMALHPTGYHMKEYKLRSWFDEAYKPLPCVATKAHACPATANWGSGVGPANYLSYGSNPPPNVHFNLAKAAGRLWAWLWVRQPLGDTNGSYDFTFIVRDGLPIQP
jgi:uncharacterized protein (TIGR03663 family)